MFCNLDDSSVLDEYYQETESTSEERSARQLLEDWRSLRLSAASGGTSQLGYFVTQLDDLSAIYWYLCIDHISK